MIQPSSNDELQIAQANWNHYVRARDSGHLRYVDEARKFDRFYLGDQWESDLRAKLESKGKPVLTLNITMSAVNAALGEHASQRVDLQAKPRLDADDDMAHVMTQVIDQILDNNNYQAVERMVFTDGLIQDRGYMDVRMDYNDNILGEARIRALDPADVLIDPDAKEQDPATWNHVITTRWHTVEEVESIYGKEYADRLRAAASAGQTLGYDSVRLDVREVRFGDTQYPQFLYTSVADAAATVRNVRVIERQHRVLTKVKQFVDLATGDTRTVPDSWDAGRVKAVAEQYGLGVRSAMVKRIRWTVTVDYLVLHDDWSPYDRFTVIPFFPAFRRGRSSGMVRQLVSPQELLNKVESQALHVVNTTANSGWIIEEGSLANMTDQEVEDRGAETGLVMVTHKGRTPPAKIQPNPPPSGLDRTGVKAANFVREISGVQSLMGLMPSPEVSGVALEGTQNRALTLLQVAFDQLAFTRKLVGEALVALIQQFYTEARVMKVTDWRSPEAPEVEIQVNQVNPLGEVLNDLTLGEYKIIVGTAPARDGAQESQFAEAMQLREVGVGIPDEVIIGYSHLAQKRQIAEIVKQMQGRGDPSTEQAQLAQIQQQLVLKKAMAEVDALVAKAQKAQSEAQLAQIKAGALAHDTQNAPQQALNDLMIEAQKIKASLAQVMSDNETKIALADKHIAGNIQIASLKALSGQTQQLMKQHHESNQQEKSSES